MCVFAMLCIHLFQAMCSLQIVFYTFVFSEALPTRAPIISSILGRRLARPLCATPKIVSRIATVDCRHPHHNITSINRTIHRRSLMYRHFQLTLNKFNGQMANLPITQAPPHLSMFSNQEMGVWASTSELGEKDSMAWRNSSP